MAAFLETRRHIGTIEAHIQVGRYVFGYEWDDVNRFLRDELWDPEQGCLWDRHGRYPGAHREQALLAEDVAALSLTPQPQWARTGGGTARMPVPTKRASIGSLAGAMDRFGLGLVGLSKIGAELRGLGEVLAPGGLGATVQDWWSTSTGGSAGDPVGTSGPATADAAEPSGSAVPHGSISAEERHRMDVIIGSSPPPRAPIAPSWKRTATDGGRPIATNDVARDSTRPIL